MKPYLAILVDSFWEAVGSKVLWALLLCWTLLLAGLAPFGYITERSYSLSSLDISKPGPFAQKLIRALKKEGPQSQQAVASRLSAEFKEKLQAAGKTTKEADRLEIRSRDIARELNALLSVKDLYSQEAFPTAANREQLKPIVERMLMRGHRRKLKSSTGNFCKLHSRST
ncbi:MAG: hypothetical protein U0892_07865 [Pirellulales bacterium]